MSHMLLLATAAAFMPRSPPTVILDSTVKLTWLREILREIRVFRGQYCSARLRETLKTILSTPDAIWMLCSFILPEFRLLDGSKLVDTYRMIHVEAYVVYVDLLQDEEVIFKLTPESISELSEYHRDIYLVNTAAACNGWSEEVNEVRDKFVKVVNKFVYRTSAKALLNLESGELSMRDSENVKTALMGSFPPPPSPFDISSASSSDITNASPSDITSIPLFDIINASLPDTTGVAQSSSTTPFRPPISRSLATIHSMCHHSLRPQQARSPARSIAMAICSFSLGRILATV
ncbi:MAG: hypothetical protein M1839_001898 [Geoglossum umbratile]|nr:MAG: hypothetical protein M1839_001898 [Geoglossum umbratile]